MNTLRVVTIVLIILAAIIAAISIYSDTPYRMMESNFKNTSPIPNIKTSNVTEKWQDQYALPDFEVGGVLANNFALNWFQDFIKKGAVTFQGTAVCAHRARKSCTAYSLLRSDLIPVLFEFPGGNQSVPCGIILDPNKAWPLITGMYHNDADTNARVCCSNEAGGEPNTVTEGSLECTSCPGNGCCNPDGKCRSIDFTAGSDFKGSQMDQCGTPNCNGNRTCMMLQSGASINAYKLAGTPAFCNKESGPNFSDSKICAKPNVCVLENAPANSTDVLGNTDSTNYKVVVEDDRIANYIGPDGEGFFKLLDAQCPGAGVDGDPTLVNTDQRPLCPNQRTGRGGTSYNDGVSQCKFKRDDWNVWIKTLKRFYVEYEKRFPNNIPQGLYLENEVNLYVNPNKSEEAFLQQKLFENAIIGFYYNATDCDQQLAWLNAQNTNRATDVKKNYSDLGSDRCDNYFGDLTKSDFLKNYIDVGLKDSADGAPVSRKQRQLWENIMIKISRQLVHQVADLFEKQTSRKVPVYKCTASSNAFMNYDEVRQAQNNNIKLSSIFQKDTGYKYSAEIQKYVNKEWIIQA